MEWSGRKEKTTLFNIDLLCRILNHFWGLLDYYSILGAHILMYFIVQYMFLFTKGNTDFSKGVERRMVHRGRHTSIYKPKHLALFAQGKTNIFGIISLWKLVHHSVLYRTVCFQLLSMNEFCVYFLKSEL